MAKVYVSEILNKIVNHALQVHGSLGYSGDLPLERFYRDAHAARIYDGPSEVHRMVIAQDIPEGGDERGFDEECNRRTRLTQSTGKLPPLVDEESLKTVCDEHFGKPAKLTVRRHQAGHSNKTFFLHYGNDELVLRRPPSGAFLPTAHDVSREYRVLDALGAELEVRSPRTAPHVLRRDGNWGTFLFDGTRSWIRRSFRASGEVRLEGESTRLVRR